MKLAITYDKENNQVFQHFGHTEFFRIVTIEGTNVTSDKIIETNGSGHGALAGFLKEQGVDTLICGGIGGGAKKALNDVGIQLLPGVTGDSDEAVVALVTNTLKFDPDISCNHHNHEDSKEHNCETNGTNKCCH